MVVNSTSINIIGNIFSNSQASGDKGGAIIIVLT